MSTCIMYSLYKAVFIQIFQFQGSVYEKKFLNWFLLSFVPICFSSHRFFQQQTILFIIERTGLLLILIELNLMSALQHLFNTASRSQK